jgi:hypothetical protein
MRKKLLILTSSLIMLGHLNIQASETLTIQSLPVGVMEVNAGAGNGSTKTVSLISAPLLRTASQSGKMSGVINAVETSRIISESAGWQPSELTNPAQPHGLMVTSGTAAGRLFLISSSTNNSPTALQVTDPHNRNLDLTTLGIQLGTDTYQIIELDTIKSLFGEPEQGNSSSVQGGPVPQQADVVTLTQNGSVSSYFYSTTHQRWTTIRLGSPDGSHTPILPYYGVQYARIAPYPLQIVLSGEVPRLNRQMTIPPHGATLVASYWPVAQSLAQTGLGSRPEWRRGIPPNVDRVSLSSPLGSSSYYHDGQNWRKISLGQPLSDEVIVNTGSAMLINRPASGSALPVIQPIPYNL